LREDALAKDKQREKNDQGIENPAHGSSNQASLLLRSIQVGCKLHERSCTNNAGPLFLGPPSARRLSDRLGREIETRWGGKALVSLALTIASARLYPSVKYALGHGQACTKKSGGI